MEELRAYDPNTTYIKILLVTEQSGEESRAACCGGYTPELYSVVEEFQYRLVLRLS
jgi:hypothetical protein